VKEAIAEKRIREIEASQLLINIMSLCIYPFAAKPVIKAFLEVDDKGFDKVMLQRIDEISEFVMHSLKPFAK
jgi:hypothetical protein